MVTESDFIDAMIEAEEEGRATARAEFQAGLESIRAERDALQAKCDMFSAALQAIRDGADTCFLYLEDHGAPPAVLAKVTDRGGLMQTIAALVLLEKIAYEDEDTD